MMFGFGAQFHHVAIMGGTPFDALSQIGVTRAGPKSRFAADGNIVTDAANALGLSYDPATGERLGYHIGGQVDRLTLHPSVSVATLSAAGGVLTDLGESVFGQFGGVRVESDGADDDGAALSIGAVAAGADVHLDVIYRAPSVGDSAARKVMVTGDGTNEASGARGSTSATGAVSVTSDSEITPGVWRLRAVFTAPSTTSYDLRVTPDTATAGEALDLLYMAAYSGLPAAPVLASPTTQATQFKDVASTPWPASLRGVDQRHDLRVRLPFDQPSGSFNFLYQAGVNSDGMRLFINGSSEKVGALLRVGAANQGSSTDGPALVAGQAYSLTTIWTGSGVTLRAGGTDYASAYSATLPSPTSVTFGQSSTGTDFPDGGIYLDNFTARRL